MRACIIIPYFNHPRTIAKMVFEAKAFCPLFVVDDGSTLPLPELPGATVVRLEANRGKGAALRAGFQQAEEAGFTHAITMDADGQHCAWDLPALLAAARAQPEALVVGIRDLVGASAPAGRRRSNAVSSFWFRVETGVRLEDTQCGFRCYPLDLARRLKVRSERYAFELEFMVRASWVGTPIVPVVVLCTYSPEILRESHFRPLRDLAHITIMNIGLVLQSWVVPRTLRVAWSFGERKPLRQTAAEFFADHAHDPLRMSLAVGLGLFFGIVPIYGLQLLVALAVAHRLRLNKAITALASNISIPPVMPFILYGGVALGHWMFTRQLIELGPREMTWARALEYSWQLLLGSVVLATVVATAGTLATYCLARLTWKR
jgi:uncharacterized protein (DUF2062 family)